MNITVQKNGLEELIESMKKNAKKIVLANLKEITRKEIQEKYKENINAKYKEIKKKLRNNNFEKTFSKECEVILEKLFGVVNINFENLEKVLLKNKEKLNKKIMKSLNKENKDKIMNKINEGFIILNSKYDNLLKYNSWYEENNYNLKLIEYFKEKINIDVNNLILEKASIIFLEKSIIFLSEIISENVKDEEIQDLVDSNVDKILKKINN